jgi:2-hydroxychromene-2-carboxylate isomerase
VKEQLKTVTQEAVARGVFGAPTFFVGDTMYWGQDRLDFVKEALEP